MKPSIVCFIVIVLISFSCASTKQYKGFPEGNGSSKVYIIRDSWLGYAVAVKIYVGDNVLGKLGINSYLSFSPTNSEIELISKMENKFKLDLKIEEGKTYYVRQKFKMGWLRARTNLKLLNEEEGKKALSKVKPPNMVDK